MGMYTGIRFKGYVKPKFRQDFKEIALNGDWKNHHDKILRGFGELDRSNFIPCGSLSYMPDEWQSYNENFKKYSSEWFESAKDTNGFDRKWNGETGYWTFQCSLKNYEGEIEEWFKIVPYFIERIEHLEYFYEEWDYSKQYDLVDGEVKIINEKFRDYGCIY